MDHDLFNFLGNITALRVQSDELVCKVWDDQSRSISTDDHYGLLGQGLKDFLSPSGMVPGAVLLEFPVNPVDPCLSR